MADKITLLLKRLHEKTLQGKVPWEQSADEGVFQASFKNYSIRISRQPSRHGNLDEEDVVFQLFNEKGELIEEVDDTSFSQPDFLPTSPFKFMADLHAMARRSAMGVDEAVDILLGELDKVN